MKISIIIATYNRGSLLPNALDSILAQTYQNYEVCIVDGDSDDGTLSIIREYEPRFGGRLRWISESDRGLYDAMNKGITMSTGDVIGILNSDDFFTAEDILETIAREIQGVDAIYGDIHYVNPDNLQKCVRYYSSRHFRPWQMRFGYMPAHPSFYARREVYEKCGLFSLDYRIAADYDLMVRFLCKYRISTRYVARDFVTMRTGGVSSSNLHNRIIITQEDAQACRRYGIYSNFLMCSVKYFTKIFEFIKK